MKIFLSYGHDEHADLVRRVKADLVAQDHDVWMDEAEIKFGQDWEHSIEVGLNSAEVVVAFMTPHAIRRPGGVCLDELAFARFQGKRIVPVLLQQVQPPLSIARLQWLDMQEWHEPDSKVVREAWYGDRLQILVQAITGELSLGFEGEQARLRDALKPLNFGTEIDRHVRGFVGRQWFFDSFDNWLATPERPRIFWATAEAGYGKSALAALLAHRNPAVVGVHFCQHNDSSRSDPRRIIQSLAYQLSTQFPDFHDYLLSLTDAELKGDEDSIFSMFDALILKPLKHTKSPDQKVLVIDALDQVQQERSSQFLQLIADQFTQLPSWLSLVVTSRPEPELVRRFSSLDPHDLRSDSDDSLADVGRCAAAEIPVSDPEGKRAVDALVEKSQGNMLYLSTALKEIAEGRLSLGDSASFPSGLSDIYLRQFERQFPDEKQYKQDQRPLLELAVATEEPLPLELASAILGWDDYERDDALEPLGSLFPIEDDRVQAYHQSVVDWLIDPDKSGRRFRVSRSRGSKLLAETLWAAYENSDEGPLGQYLTGGLPSALAFSGEWQKLETFLVDPRTPLVPDYRPVPYRFVNEFPQDWDLTALRGRISADFKAALEPATKGGRLDGLSHPLRVLGDILSARTAPWLFELLEFIESGPIRFPAFFRHQASDTSYTSLDNPDKRIMYRSVRTALETARALGIGVPDRLEALRLELRRSSLYLEGAYRLEDDAEISDLAWQHVRRIVYRGEYDDDDPRFNTFSLVIEVLEGRGDLELVKKLIEHGADISFQYDDEDLASIAQRKGDTEIAELLRARGA